MRGVYFILLLLSMSVVIGFNSTTYQAGDFFVVDANEYYISKTYENATHIRFKGFGKLYSEGECNTITWTKFCVNESTNISVKINTYDIPFNISINRTMPEDIEVGEPYEVRFVIQSNLRTREEISFEEHTEHEVLKKTGFGKDLTWKGYIDPGHKRTLWYTAIATKEGKWNMTSFAHASSSTTENASIEVDDYISLDTDYEDIPVLGEKYNFTLEIDSDDAVESEIIFFLPESMSTFRKSNLSANGRTLRKELTINTTQEYWFTYVITDIEPENMTLLVTTTRNDTSVIRNYTFSFTPPYYSPPVLFWGDTKKIAFNTTENISLQIINPGEELSTTLDIQSVLVNSQEKVTLPTNGSIVRNYGIKANHTHSEYLIAAELSFVDPKGNDVSVKELLELQSYELAPTQKEEIPELQILLLGDKELGSNESGSVFVEVQNAQNITITVYKDGVYIQDKILGSSTNATIILPGPGMYTLSLASNAGVKNTTYVVAQKQVIEFVEKSIVEEDNHSAYWPYALGIALLGMIAYGFFVATRPSLQELREEQRRLQHDRAVLNTFYPASRADFLTKQELESQLVRKEEKLKKLLAKRK